MTGFFGKLRTFSLGAAHDLLDKAIDHNSPSMLRQYVRDIEAALDSMRNEAAVMEGTTRTLTREKSDLERKIETDKTTVQQLIAKGDPIAKTLARTRAAMVVDEQRQLEEKTLQLENQQTAAAQVEQAVVLLQGKHDMILARVRELENLDMDSKSKEHAASALHAAASVAGSVDSRSIDNLEDRMRQRNDMAGAKFDQAISAMQPEQEENTAAIDALMASLTPAAK